MTKNILAVVGGLALVALLGASAVATFGGGEQLPSGTGGGLRVADLPINRSFQIRVPAPQTMTFPTDAGRTDPIRVIPTTVPWRVPSFSVRGFPSSIREP